VNASWRRTSVSEQFRANWCWNMIASTSMPFIVMMRHRVYGSTASGSIGSTLSSRQLRI
jgi:hypothetical protein